MGVGEAVHVDVPIISYPKPEDTYWAGPVRHDLIQSSVTLRNRRYQFWINSLIPVPAAKYYGNYTLFVEGMEIITIRIQTEGELYSISVNLHVKGTQYA
jgi:hypothetical protein